VIVDLATCSYKGFHPSMGIPVKTSVGKPRFKLSYEIHAEMKTLAPRYNMLKMPYDEYRYRYEKLLAAATAPRLDDQFKMLMRTYKKYGDRLVLLCFEDVIEKGDWCHRRMFAKWWKTTTLRDVPELYLNLQTGQIEEYLDTKGDHPPKLEAEDAPLF
jgi:hypothetical protein